MEGSAKFVVRGIPLASQSFDCFYILSERMGGHVLEMVDCE
jgi:hypothetical protein